MAESEWLLAHRELQYLRAAARCHPRRRASRSDLAQRRAYAQLRWQKLQQTRKEMNDQ